MGNGLARDTSTDTAWLLAGATKDQQNIAADWHPIGRRLIEGVTLREARVVPKRNGHVTELYRNDWFPAPDVVGQVFIVTLRPGGVSAWHAHDTAIDRLTVVTGAATFVLYDGRAGSPTRGLVNEFHLLAARPTTIVIPPRVWHGVQNSSETSAILANMPDRPYCYEDPDHWRVDPDSAEIPYRFLRAGDAI
jgi:dTDP-4-dehydrorhamnose 3,5-epimerase